MSLAKPKATDTNTLYVVGTDGPDVLDGTAIGESIHGAGGDDRLNGGGGNDNLYGDDGDDVISGGLGRDTLSGGREPTPSFFPVSARVMKAAVRAFPI